MHTYMNLNQVACNYDCMKGWEKRRNTTIWKEYMLSFEFAFSFLEYWIGLDFGVQWHQARLHDYLCWKFLTNKTKLQLCVLGNIPKAVDQGYPTTIQRILTHNPPAGKQVLWFSSWCSAINHQLTHWVKLLLFFFLVPNGIIWRTVF